MVKLWLINWVTIIALLVFVDAHSQNVGVDGISKAEVSKLEFLVGNWEGKGWMMSADGVKREFDQTERIQFKLDSTAILIEGKGRSGGNVIHNAMAIVSFNKMNSRYNFHSYLQNGSNNQFEAELKDGKFYWYPNEFTRFIIWINEKEQWYEKGEYNNGGNWFQFFEMTLNKK